MESTSGERRRELFDKYIEERRASPSPGFGVEVLPHFTRYLPRSGEGEGMVMYARISGNEAERHIREQASYFAARNLVLEWKVYDLDRPANLKALLEGAGIQLPRRGRGADEPPDPAAQGIHVCLRDLSDEVGAAREAGKMKSGPRPAPA